MTGGQTLLWVEPDLGTVSGGLRYNQQLRQALVAHGAEVQTLSLPPEAFAGDGPGARQLQQARQQLRPDVVVIDGLIGSAHPELFSAGTAPGQTVLLLHLPVATALAAEGRDDPEAVSREKRAVLHADHVVTVSRWSAGELRRRYRREDIYIALPGVQLPEEIPAPQGRSRGPQLVSVGALNPLKNHALLGEALKPLLALEWKLLLAGPGAESEYGRRVLSVMDELLPGRVEHRGVLSPQQMGALWAEADLVLLPSLVETYGMVVTEACAHGVPAFVSAGTGAQEAVQAAGAALDPQLPEVWTARLQRFVAQPEDRAELRRAALRRRSSLPTWSGAAEVFAALG